MKLCHKMKVYQRLGDPEDNNPRPEIRIVGKWLEDAGFRVGDPIYILINNKGQLIIEDEQTHFLLRT